MSNRVDRAVQRKKKANRKKIAKVVIPISACVTLTLTIIVGVKIYNKRMNIGLNPINWDKISLDVETDGENLDVEPLGGTVTQESYHKVRMKASAELLQQLEEIITEEVYLNILEGIQSDKYKEVVYSEYTQTAGEIRNMMAQTKYIIEMYDDYKSNADFVDITGCNTDVCDLKEFIESYTGNELKEYLLDIHQKWESLKAYSMKHLEVDDNALNMVYQEEIVTNMDYIEDIEVVVYIINNQLKERNDSKLVERLRSKGKIPTRVLTIDNKESLNMLSLYRSNNFYDGNIAGLAKQTMESILGDADKVIDLTGVDDLENAIRNIDKPTKSKDITSKDILSLPYISYSLIEGSDESTITIYFDITRIKHIDNIPTIEDIKEKLVYKARGYLAESSIYDELDSRIKEDIVGEDQVGEDQVGEDEGHDHDGDGIPDHIFDEETQEWLVYDGNGNYIRE